MGIDFTQINVIFNRITSIFMAFLVVTLITLLPIITLNDGFTLLESVLSRIFLENYTNYESTLIVTGNQWSLYDLMKNGNFISILLFSFTNIFSILNLASLTSKRLLRIVMLIFLSVLLFGIIHNRLEIL